MRHDCEVTLITQYRDGVEIKEKETKIYGKRKSVTRSEFYASYGVGLSAKCVFVVNPAEYVEAEVTTSKGAIQEATHVEYNGQRYKIIRTYETNRFEMELTVG